jgi:predicted nucleic acid-binding protein
MILDTNALSAWADGDPTIESHLRTAKKLIVPSIVLGEFDFGIRQSRHYVRYAEWLKTNLVYAEVANVDAKTAKIYGEIRLTLKKAGTPIPVNDTWVAAIACQHHAPLLTHDSHFDNIKSLDRIPW